MQRVNIDEVCPKISAAKLRPEERAELCCICLQELAKAEAGELPEEPEPATSLPLDNTLRRLCCGHVFHAACIDSWIREGKPCALCRAPPFDSVVRLELSSASGTWLEEVNAERPSRTVGVGLYGLRFNGAVPVGNAASPQLHASRGIGLYGPTTGVAGLYSIRFHGVVSGGRVFEHEQSRLGFDGVLPAGSPAAAVFGGLYSVRFTEEWP